MDNLGNFSLCFTFTGFIRDRGDGEISWLLGNTSETGIG